MSYQIKDVIPVYLILVLIAEDDFYLIEVQLIYNVVLVSSVQPVIQLYIYILFQIIFPYRSLQNLEYSSLYGRSLLVIYFTYSSVYMLIPNFSVSSIPLFPFGNFKFVFYVCESISVYKQVYLYHYFQIPQQSVIISHLLFSV